MVTLIRKNYQLTLPASVRKRLRLKVGDVVEITEKEGKIVLIPKKTIDPDQAYFWSKEWQGAEREVEDNLRKGKIHKAENVFESKTPLPSHEAYQRNKRHLGSKGQFELPPDLSEDQRRHFSPELKRFNLRSI